MKGFSVALLISLVAVASAYPKDRCVCTFMFLPLCASNGVTYANKCEFECDKRKEFNKGKINYNNFLYFTEINFVCSLSFF